MIRANSMAADSANNYASAALYAPQGALCALENGGYIISSLVYNSRLQPGRISASSSGSAPSACPTSISGTGSVLDLSYNFNFGTADNGNVMGIANNRNTARSETFTYDALNRVSTAWSNGNLWGEAYSIDPWGNLNQFGPYQNSQNQIVPFVEANQSLAANTQNQVSAFCYDTAGNVLAEAGSQCPPAQGSGFVYNAENQLTFAGGTNYVYDGDGNRVEKYMLNTQNQIVFQELYWYGGGSAPLDETDGTGSTTNSAFNEYVFFNGARTARRNSGGVYYYFADHLGTSREIVQSGSTTPCYDADFTPYGVEIPNTNTCAQNYKFTGKERDTESGLDNFGARYNSSSVGRFMTPDRSPDGVAMRDPQSWNLYSYVRNRPTLFFDPAGNWATPVHGQIVTFAMQDYVSAGELKELIQMQSVMDSDQSPGHQFMHFMSNGQAHPPQSAADATNLAWQFVAGNMALAENFLDSNGFLTTWSLIAMGAAMHTVEDHTSPMHTAANGDPLPWNGYGTFGSSALRHWEGENSPAEDWAGIGYAIRLTMAVYLEVGSKCEAGKTCLTEQNFESEVNKNISAYVNWYYGGAALDDVDGDDGVVEQEEARQCALGNPAACPDH